MNTQIRKMNETNLTGKAEEKRKKSKSHDKQKTYHVVRKRSLTTM